MNARCRMAAAKLWLAAGLAVGCTTIVNAQLSTSLGGGGPLSAPLDSDLNGLDSTVAPIPSSTIEPGANNLLNPDSRELPYDAIGASIDATLMSPSATQFYPLLLSRSAYQLDTQQKDATRFTGLHTQIPANIIDVITRKPEWLGSSAVASSFAQKPAFSANSLLARFSQGSRSARQLSEMRGNLSGTLGQQSSVGGSTPIGGSATSPAMPDSLQLSQGTAQMQMRQSANANNRNDLLLGNGATPKSGGRTSSSHLVAEPDKPDISPLESPSFGNLPTMTVGESPFENLSQGNFLTPDITRIARPRYGREKGGTFSDRARSENSTVLQSGFPLSGMKNQEISPGASRLMKLSSSKKVERGPKWHNPILQQMETGSNLDRGSPLY